MMFLMCLRTSFSKYFMRMEVSASGQWSFGLNTADYVGTGIMVADLQQVGTLSCGGEMLKMSMISGWNKFFVQGQGHCQAQQLYSY